MGPRSNRFAWRAIQNCRAAGPRDTDHAEARKTHEERSHVRTCGPRPLGNRRRDRRPPQGAATGAPRKSGRSRGEAVARRTEAARGLADRACQVGALGPVRVVQVASPDEYRDWLVSALAYPTKVAGNCKSDRRFDLVCRPFSRARGATRGRCLELSACDSRPAGKLLGPAGHFPFSEVSQSPRRNLCHLEAGRSFLLPIGPGRLERCLEPAACDLATDSEELPASAA